MIRQKMAQDPMQLDVYKKAYGFALSIYKITSAFPKEEQFGITSQLRRAASSIGANIAEGCGRRTEADLGKFLYIAMGSVKETEHFIGMSKDLNYIPGQDYHSIIAELDLIGRMLNKFIQRVKEKC